MKTTVHILATVRKPELLEAALLVFRTLRQGFPTSPVQVWGNALDDLHERTLHAAAMTVGATFHNLPPTVHDEWIETLIQRSTTPFWVCDTDMVFWENVEHFSWPELFAGRFEPEFHEEWTDTRHVARLHTCLMQINPAPLRAAMQAWMSKIPMPWRATAQFPLIRQNFIPVAGTLPLFYDTCAGLHQAFGGTPFNESQDLCFEHLHCATYADLVDAPTLADLIAVHRGIYANHHHARGLSGGQEEYYRRRRLTPAIP